MKYFISFRSCEREEIQPNHPIDFLGRLREEIKRLSPFSQTASRIQHRKRETIETRLHCIKGGCSPWPPVTITTNASLGTQTGGHSDRLCFNNAHQSVRDRFTRRDAWPRDGVVDPRPRLFTGRLSTPCPVTVMNHRGKLL